MHIVSSALLFGTGLGTAFFMFFANRSDDTAALAVVSKLVVRADWWFTAPTVIIQPATGAAMAWLAGWPLSTSWLATSIALFLFAGACWLPVVWLQIEMSAIANESRRFGRALPSEYYRYARIWERLGYPAFASMVIVFGLMVNKPRLW